MGCVIEAIKRTQTRDECQALSVLEAHAPDENVGLVWVCGQVSFVVVDAGGRGGGSRCGDRWHRRCLRYGRIICGNVRARI
jgi:hypothetical protein